MMTIANETAGILRAFYARGISICPCSRSSNRERCIRMADVLLIDHPDNRYTFKTFWSPAFCIEKARANKTLTLPRSRTSCQGITTKR